MMLRDKIKNLILNPKYIIVFLNNRGIVLIKDDEKYLKFLYKLIMNDNLNLENPQTFNEKLQWLKLYDRKDIYTCMVDKYEVKKYVSKKIGKDYIIPTLGVYNNFDEINFDKLPKQFVIKCTHDSGGIVICKDKFNFNYKSAMRKINRCLKRKFYFANREWPYKNVKPRIIVEKYLEDNRAKELVDYKLFCFNGEPKFTLVCSERFSSLNMCETFFDNQWNLIPLVENNHRIDKNIMKPKNFDKMLEFARKLAENIPFVRIDFYEIKNKLFFGEITFFPASGYEKFEPVEYNYLFGEWIDLSDVKKNEK